MSIIYRALQKTQKNREKDGDISMAINARYKSHWIDIGLGIIISLLLFIVVFSYLPHLEHYFSTLHFSKPTPAPVAIKLINETEYKNQFILNGIFTSDQTKTAVVNNQYLHLGDVIGGMKIVNIGNDNIQVQNATQTIMLRVPI